MISTNQKLIFVAINLLYLLGVKFSGPPFGNAPFSSSYSVIIFIVLFALNIAIYKALKIDTKDNFTFEVTPAKLCRGGEYMYSSNPERQKLCSNISQENIDTISCNQYQGGVGQPIYLNRSEISDSKWQNNMCENIGGGVPPLFQYMYS